MSFEYKFRLHGGGSEQSLHCTYCPKRPGEACELNCAGVYAQVKAEREADHVIVNDEPPATS